MKLQVRRGARIVGEYDQRSLVIALENGEVSAFDDIVNPETQTGVKIEAIRELKDFLNTNFDWKLNVAGVEMGPMTKREVMSRIEGGKLNEDDMAYHPKTGEWAHVGEIAEFSYALEQMRRQTGQPSAKERAKAKRKAKAALPSTKKCEKCGAENSSKNLTCLKCGARFPKEGEAAEEYATPALDRVKAGALAGAVTAVGCSVPIVILSLISIGIIAIFSIFLPIAGALAAGVLFFKLIALILAGALVGSVIGYLGAFDFGRGGGIGSIVGAIFGLLFAVMAKAGYVFSTIGWAFDCMIMGMAVVYVAMRFFDARNIVLPERLRPEAESSKTRMIGIVLGVLLGIVIAIFMIRGQIESNQPGARRSRAVKAIEVQAKEGYYETTQGATLQEYSVEGSLINISKRPKFMIGLQGYLFDANGDTIGKQYDTFTRKRLSSEEVMKGDLSKVSTEMARAGALRPREKADFKMTFNVYGTPAEVARYEIKVTSALDYGGEL
jgi:hypothetical protein